MMEDGFCNDGDNGVDGSSNDNCDIYDRDDAGNSIKMVTNDIVDARSCVDNNNVKIVCSEEDKKIHGIIRPRPTFKVAVSSTIATSANQHESEEKIRENTNIMTDDSDDDDDVNIIIQQSRVNASYTSYMDELVKEDLELNVEIKSLFAKSLHDRTLNNNKPIVTLFVQDTVIPIDVDCVISSRLSTLVWGTELPYKKYELKNVDCFDDMLLKYKNTMMRNDDACEDSDKFIAFFATIYENMQKNGHYFADQRSVQREQRRANSGVVDDSNHNNNCLGTRSKKLHFFHKFAVIVLKNGHFVDAAIHGFRSSVTAVIKKYKPERIYCIGGTADTIDAFLKFKHQPFYSELYNNVRYIGNKLIRNQTSIMFCPVNMKFCAFCRATDTILTYFTNLRQHRTLPVDDAVLKIPRHRSCCRKTLSLSRPQTERSKDDRADVIDKIDSSSGDDDDESNRGRNKQSDDRRRNHDQRHHHRRRQQQRPQRFPRLSTLVDEFKIPTKLPYRVLNSRPQMRCEKYRRLGSKRVRPTNNGTYVVGKM